ncbi:hypothetical protein F4808DRAFT_443162 [Astrocystis sublimbata]|nr:hypothetical protein F4808DRAFT_446375 [Astrocystis sublimbata]KAI0188227.1 hypothetical protein F4808DRAFT_446376 [Astrocystis sublimbata]KAI0192450.1 hypothetical protein F4808DRAFT_443161 [Astrocystis sublimbata]KAI0192451.1 hypothetical protein F4808DRAFT_443162 [Astrocystis sublimbata]
MKTGQALVFAPSAAVALDRQSMHRHGLKAISKKLVSHVLRVIAGLRITADRGRSIMAS